MKLIHLADLHIGKRLANYALIEDQRYIFDQILKHTQGFAPDAVLVAGDIFDRANPSEEAVALYGDFFTRLAECAPVYAVPGNHDSPPRLALFSGLLRRAHIHIADTPQSFACGEAVIHLLPYQKGSSVQTYETAVLEGLEKLKPQAGKQNILVSHQFYINKDSDRTALPDGSERLVLGGIDALPAGILRGYDYVALGHLHGPRALAPNIRYAGAPLKYATGESAKSLCCVTLSEHGLHTEQRPLKPLRDVRSLTGSFEELCADHSDDYVELCLKEEKPIVRAADRLRESYPNMLWMRYEENRQERAEQAVFEDNPTDMLTAFFEANGKTLTETEKTMAEDLFRTLQEQA